MAIRQTKTSLPRLFPYRFFDAQNVENAFGWTFDIMKHRLLEFTKVALQDVQKPVYDFSSFDY
jgi:hypothetical protein